MISQVASENDEFNFENIKCESRDHWCELNRQSDVRIGGWTVNISNGKLESKVKVTAG